MCECAHANMSERVRVCVCVRERERERERGASRRQELRIVPEINLSVLVVSVATKH